MLDENQKISINCKHNKIFSYFINININFIKLVFLANVRSEKIRYNIYSK